jgi:hypothetical protein
MRNRENAKDRQEFWTISIGILKIVDDANRQMSLAHVLHLRQNDHLANSKKNALQH